MELYLVRHGEACAPEEDRRRPLTDVGREHARRVALAGQGYWGDTPIGIDVQIDDLGWRNHGTGVGQEGCVPMEFWQDNFDAIQYVTRQGIMVLEAAGNGQVDLDAAVDGGLLDPGLRRKPAVRRSAAGAESSRIRSRPARRCRSHRSGAHSA